MDSDPSPTQYQDSNNCSSFQKANASFNIQGFGGFISKSRRFAPRNSCLAPRPGPGPCKYSPRKIDRKDSRIGLDPAFCAPPVRETKMGPGRPMEHIQHFLETPVVGAYDPVIATDVRKTLQGHKNVFKESKSERVIGLKTGEAPPVGWYEVAPGNIDSTGHRYGSLFSKPTEKLQKSVNEREFPLPKDHRFDLQAVDGLVKEVKPTKPVPPPVGTYISHQMWQPEVSINASVLGSASFVAYDKQGRSAYLGLSKSVPSLGPGAYNVKEKAIKPRLKGLVDLDMVAQRPGLPIKKDAPGPAFYQPKDDVIKGIHSFHLNLHDKWV
eukprot:GDKJ01059019.1.p1 GENE.GDKJ01059019.1~~GDKJ01059019.1.p1  ORF type:complete len:325 (-),score=37.40 GDKJ01059019.1:17-991(-)